MLWVAFFLGCVNILTICFVPDKKNDIKKEIKEIEIYKNRTHKNIANLMSPSSESPLL